MIVEYIRYRIAAANVGGFEKDYAEAAKSLDESKYCLAYELSCCTEDPGCYVLRIEWDSVEGHMQGFRSSDNFRSFFAAIKPYLGCIEEMRHYVQTAVMSRADDRRNSTHAQ